MANIVLLDKSGSSDVYSTGRGIRLYAEDGLAHDFFPNNYEKVTLDADFSDGNMIIEPSGSSMLEEVTVVKPINLIPSNIAKDVDIAGIVGTYEGSTGVEIDPGLKYFAYNIDVENSTVTLYRVLYDKIYEDTGTYDVNIPDQFGALKVIIASE